MVHVASPLDTQNTGDPSLVIGPAVAGVTGLLESLLGTEVKRVVQISSVAAIAAGEKGVHTEAEWNEVAPAVCDKEGAAANGGIKYAASKALAERAFWKFFDQKRGFDGVSLNPGFVFGPPTQYAPGGEIVGSNGGWVLDSDPSCCARVPHSRVAQGGPQPQPPAMHGGCAGRGRRCGAGVDAGRRR